MKSVLAIPETALPTAVPAAPPWPRPLLAGFLLAAALGLVPHPAQASLTYGLERRADRLQELTGEDLVRRVQESLRAAGYYQGPVDGRGSEGLSAAIKRFQGHTGLKPDGRITEDLAKRLETGERIETLLKRLREAREAEIDSARAALLAQPETAALVEGGAKPEKADPTRDPSHCFAKPDPTCLLTEAAETSKGVARAEMRDWALGELLVAQTRAGLDGEAMATAGRIADPRLILVALRDIAETQARVGRIRDALSAAQVIPDPAKKADALLAVGEIVAGDQKSTSESGTKSTAMDDIAMRVRGALAGLNDPQEKSQRLGKLAVLKAKAGDRAGAEVILDYLARQSDAPRRAIAAAWAELGEADRAAQLLKGEDQTPDNSRQALSVTAAKAAADQGEDGLALDTAEQISASRYRAVVLARIAAAQARAGALEAAKETLAKARTATEDVSKGYARSYAQSRLALAELALATRTGDYADLRQTAEAIKDAALKAEVLWLAHSENGEADWEAAALAATDKVISRLTRAWLFADLAERQQNLNRPELARALFDRGLGVAESIRNPWGRTRALAKLAAALSTLNRAQCGESPCSGADASSK